MCCILQLQSDNYTIVAGYVCDVCVACDAALSHQEKLLLANREKDKGNEAFRANDYEEAVAYYSRSGSLNTFATMKNFTLQDIILNL